MSRSKWKGPFINKNVIYLQKNVFCKSSVITQKLLNKIIYIYNGKEFISLLITDKMLGHKIGEFIHTRKNFNFKK